MTSAESPLTFPPSQRLGKQIDLCLLDTVRSRVCYVGKVVLVGRRSLLPLTVAVPVVSGAGESSGRSIGGGIEADVSSEVRVCLQ